MIKIRVLQRWKQEVWAGTLNEKPHRLLPEKSYMFVSYSIVYKLPYTQYQVTGGLWSTEKTIGPNHLPMQKVIGIDSLYFMKIW